MVEDWWDALLLMEKFEMVAIRICYQQAMEFLQECLCDGQLEDLIEFLRGFEHMEFVVSSTNRGETSALTSNTFKDIAYEIKNDSLICPIHGCKIIVPEMSSLFKRDDISYKKKKQKR